ncbi:MAG: aminotransferase class I/II-fold pyridoxal phosphate-dependent enzyme, partial [Cyclobacteriaceae bacterium]|nr:aminotransferase class I/II-fold pyridoxal phosphate-dependent enzyme [Cyclobacteriaceae bacterium]
MYKSRNLSFIDTVDSCLSNGVKNEVFHLTTEDDFLDGRTIQLNGEKLINFGSCSYLGLETNERIKQGAIKATLEQGTQFSSSRLFIQNKLYIEAENLLEQIFESPVLLSPTTTLGHMAAIPVLVQDEDLIILDHQVHGSVQNAVNLIKYRGVKVEIIRHNDLQELEEIIKRNNTKYNKIWYMIDGVYSMYGDYSPKEEIINLLEKYENFWVYCDDAHGMSWTGKNGRGYFLGENTIHEHMIVASSLCKAFGCGGGVLVFPNQELKRRVRTCGSSFTFSGPVQPPILGAIIEAAKIH